MAYTVNKNSEVMGDMRVVVATVTADAAEANLQLGLAYIHHASVGIVSCATGTALPHVHVNKNSSGTASNGTVGVSGVTSGDVFTIVAYGR